jgi:hypothetical protein
MDTQADTEQAAWTPRHEFASRAMRAFIANAGRDPEQPALHLPTVAASSVEMADAMLAAMSKRPEQPQPAAPTLAEFVAASGTADVLRHYEAVRGDLTLWQERALKAEARLAKLGELGETIVAKPYDRRAH